VAIVAVNGFFAYAVVFWRARFIAGVTVAFMVVDTYITKENYGTEALCAFARV
jgi:hypothetical protein